MFRVSFVKSPSVLYCGTYDTLGISGTKAEVRLVNFIQHYTPIINTFQCYKNWIHEVNTTSHTLNGEYTLQSCGRELWRGTNTPGHCSVIGAIAAVGCCDGIANSRATWRHWIPFKSELFRANSSQVHIFKRLILIYEQPW
jgi:hypothetical protein